MIQFHDFGIDIQTYTDRGKGNDFPDVNQCPHCSSRRPLHRHGYYQRYALTAEGGVSPLDRTIRSRECRKTVSVLPSFLLPYVQYTRSVIWQAVKAWFETPRARSEDQTGCFSHQGGHLVLCPTIFTESLPLASRGGEKVGNHRPCRERKNRMGGLVDADLGGTGGGLDHPRPVDKREMASVCGSNFFLIFYLTPKMEMVDVPTNPSSRRISSRFVR